MTRLKQVYGKTIGTLVADAAYDGEPFRRAAGKAGYRFVIRPKNQNIDPGKRFRQAVDRRDRERTQPDQRYAEASSRRRYECWDEPDPILGLRDIEARRTTRAVRSGKEEVHKVDRACVIASRLAKLPFISQSRVTTKLQTQGQAQSHRHNPLNATL